MKKLLLQLDSDKHPSVFDTITAYDAGADHVLAIGNVAVEDVRDLVYGAMFTRGGEALKNSAVFIGGSDVPTGEAMLKAAVDAFFGPVRVSVMMDSNGCNTTAASAVANVRGHKLLIPINQPHFEIVGIEWKALTKQISQAIEMIRERMSTSS